MSDPFSGICKKCSKRSDCKTPCAPVEMEVRPNNYTARLFERDTRFGGQDIIMVYPHSREIQFANMGGKDLSKGMPHVEEVSTEDADFWPSFEANKKLTGIFLDRLINRMDWEDIAVKYDCGKKENAAYYFSYAKERLFLVLRELDKATNASKMIHEKSLGRLSKAARAFLLCKCFDLTIKQVSEILKDKTENIKRCIGIFARQVEEGKSPLVFEGEDLTGRSASYHELRGTKPVTREERNRQQNERRRARLKEAKKEVTARA